MIVEGGVDTEVVAHGPDVSRAAEQTDKVNAVLTLQAVLFEESTKLTHVLRIHVAVRTQAPFSSHFVDREFHSHQTEWFSAFLDAGRLG